MNFETVKRQLVENPRVWLITGVAGFIGSNLLETLLKLNQSVVGLDNFSTGKESNLEEVQETVTAEQWSQFTFKLGDICNLTDCKKAVEGVNHVLHQAALGSVPRSIADPIKSNEANVTGFLNMLVAAKESNVDSFTYAASSSTYGDHPALPKVEDVIGKPLSPYAVTKYVNELYANVFAKVYGFKAIGLRYFNVFGKRQNPDGPYAAVIPCWFRDLINGKDVVINGDGDTSRDFCFIENAVQANILSALSDESAKDEIYNIAVGDRTSLNELYTTIVNALDKKGLKIERSPQYKDFREGDVRHSLADISKAKNMLGYHPTHNVSEGIEDAVTWYLTNI